MEYRVIDPRTDGDCLGGAVDASAIYTIYCLAPDKALDTLEMYESTLARPTRPTMGTGGPYKVVRVA